MPDNLTWEKGTALGSLCVLFRLSGMFVVVPIPGLRLVPAPIRASCALLLALAVFSARPVAFPSTPSAGHFLLIALGEIGLGLLAGVIAGLLGDLLLLAVQTFALQAGYSYASSIDPNSEADSNVLQSFAQLASTLLFFQMGMPATLLRAFERSLSSWPPGAFWHGQEPAAALIQFGATVFELALRLALPFAGLLLLTDLTLALLGRLNSQLQLLSLAFPVKMLGSLALFAALSALVPGVYRLGAAQATEHLARWMP
jgi:flagellar biosynthetic protein FliR